MFRSLLSLFTTTGRKTRGQARPRPPRRRQSPSALRLEELADTRDLPAARLSYPALADEVVKLQRALVLLAGRAKR